MPAGRRSNQQSQPLTIVDNPTVVFRNLEILENLFLSPNHAVWVSIMTDRSEPPPEWNFVIQTTRQSNGEGGLSLDPKFAVCEWTHRSPGRSRPDHFRLVACGIVICLNLDTAPRTNLRVSYRILVRFRPCLSDCTYLYSHFYPAHFTSSNHTSEPVQTCVSGRPSQWHRRRPTNRVRPCRQGC